MVRVTHCITLCFFALLASGTEILVSHPRFYWGQTGNVTTPALFVLPIPASRATVPTRYGFVLPDQNGWSRSLHFEAAWAVVLTGPAPGPVRSLLAGNLRRNRRSSAVQATGCCRTRSYNVLQRLAYLSVIFVLFPLVVSTGLAMSPAIASVFPSVVTVLGGRQSACTIHFFATVLLVLFLVTHLVMLFLAGFRNRMSAMITGRNAIEKELV